MTNGQFYVSNKALAEAFMKFCKGTEGVNCDSCPVQKEIYQKGIKTSDCKLVWLDMPHCEEPRVSGIVSVHCTQCKKWEAALHGSVNNGFCRDGVRRTDAGKIEETCAWFDLRKPSPFSESADTPVLRPDRRRIAPCNCSHHGDPILDSDHGRCTHPANSATGTTCGFWNAADCFRFTEKDNTKTVDTPPPAPSSPATESVPCAPSHGSVPPFAPTLADAFEALERKAYYRGLLHGLNEAKRHLQITAGINAATADVYSIQAGAGNKLAEVNELIDRAKWELRS